MKTVGEILRKEREKQGKTIRQIQRQTKIGEKILKALESNDFSSLPPAPFIKGFIRSYSQALGLDSARLVAIFRRSWQENERKKIIPQWLVNPLDKQKLVWTPKTTLILSAILIIFIFLGFITFQLLNFILPPKLTVMSPLENQAVKKDIILVAGEVNKEASVYVNDKLVKTDDQGKFSYQLKLFAGQNLIEIKAIDRRGKKRVVKRTVDKIN